MMSGVVRNVAAVLLLDGLDLSENVGIEIFQPKPENVLLFLDRFLELQLFGEQAVPACGIDEPAGVKRLFLAIGVAHGSDVPTSAVDFDPRHRAFD